jgi:exonuclease SbcC
MIPVKLELKNFMPYRDNVPTLHFNEIHTASIWGANGNGKSSLMDAITWAIWGKTRAKSDDDIIHLGQNETTVEFDFLVSNTLYRVIRKHALPKRKSASGQSSLDLLVSDDEGNFRAISGNTIPQTQQQIIDILHMDYATFVNSAYLRQGHADEFTQQPPVKRKEVLASILGLSRYDRLEEKARENARKKETEKTLAESAIKDIGEELAKKPEYENELTLVQAELANMDTTLQEKERVLSGLRQRKEMLDNQRLQVEQTERRILESSRMKDLLENQLKQLATRISAYEGLIAQRGAIETEYDRYMVLKKQNEELDKKYRQITALNEKKYKIEMEVMRAGQVLAGERKLIENTITRLRESYNKLDILKVELLGAEKELATFDDQDESIRQKKQTVKERQTEIANLEVTGNRIKQEVTELSEKLELLSSQPGAKCPLCERELGEEHRNLIVDKYNTESDQKTALLEKTRQEYSKLVRSLKETEQEITGMEKKLTQARNAVQNRISVLNRDIAEAEKTGNQLVEEEKRLADIIQQIEGKGFVAEEQQTLHGLNDELALLAYDAGYHEAVRSDLESMAKVEEPKRKLDEALKNIDTDKTSFAETEESLTNLTRSLESELKKKSELEIEITSLPHIARELADTESEYRDIGQKQKQVQESAGRLKGLLQRSAELEMRAKEKGTQFELAAREELIYTDLAKAFGKRGIQMWLIETAIPEIENEANRLLGRMTDNRMHVKFETQRETKRGTTQETLDINISDELGIRNYEMFSGGEAFRIDFAIRIALSKLLARRAGAPLPTLIIDEGFGTQDANGLEKLKEAIISIQDDFKKILVVTHIEEFRDAFPTRIDIIKTADGSTIEVN